MGERLRSALWCGVMGAGMGFASTWLMWKTIYAMGAGVIEYHDHYELAPLLYLVGILSGAVIGIIAGCVIKRPFVVMPLGYLFTLACYHFVPLSSWRDGILIYAAILVGWMTLLMVLFRIITIPETEEKDDV